MKVHIFQHTADTPPGTTEEWLQQKGLSYTVTRFFDTNYEIPALADIDFLILCGGEANVDEERKYPWLVEEKKFIRSAIDSKKKVLGLCLGGQLIADVLGAKVGRHKNWEIGWFPVNLTSVSGFPIPVSAKPLMVFQYHEYSFAIPKGAEKFAQAEGCENQGFIYAPYVVGVQFHPETTKDWVKMCSEDPITKTLQKKPYVQAPEDMMNGNVYQTALQNWYFELLNQFL